MVLGVASRLFLFRRKFGLFVSARIAFGCYIPVSLKADGYRSTSTVNFLRGDFDSSHFMLLLVP